MSSKTALHYSWHVTNRDMATATIVWAFGGLYFVFYSNQKVIQLVWPNCYN